MTLTNPYDLTSLDSCDYGSCERPADAVIAFYAHDDGSPLAAIGERRPFCTDHALTFRYFAYEMERYWKEAR